MNGERAITSHGCTTAHPTSLRVWCVMCCNTVYYHDILPFLFLLEVLCIRAKSFATVGNLNFELKSAQQDRLICFQVRWGTLFGWKGIFYSKCFRWFAAKQTMKKDADLTFNLVRAATRASTTPPYEMRWDEISLNWCFSMTGACRQDSCF